ncbi:MAG: T9SS type A sorting domain-containing protein [candidate division Zixibacteria bacterium]|nr:T9SS type A sorting domain-containing protein [candidate division Zixibacteria bacterium]
MNPKSILILCYISCAFLLIAPISYGNHLQDSIPTQHITLQGGDTVEDAVEIPSIPFSTSGTTIGYNNDYDEMCPYTGQAPDVVYYYEPAESLNLSIHLCAGSDYDTKLYVYENEYILVECNDDVCISPNYPWDYVSSIESVIMQPGNIYYVVVDGYGQSQGNYTIDIAEFGSLCCVVDMWPDDDPVIVNPGERFGLTGYIGNSTSDLIVTDAWGGVIYNGNYFQQFAYNDISLDDGEALTAHTWQNVPMWAPQGTYGYIAYCGDQPDTKCDSAMFSFTVTGARLADGATEWSFDGNFLGEELIPTKFAMDNAYPNPFNATTTISYQLPVASSVNLDIYNVLGQRVTTLVNGNVEAGYHSVSWDASNYSSGVYFYKLKIGDKVITKRMTLLK